MSDKKTQKYGSNPEIENIIRAIKKNERSKRKNEYIKINYRALIDPKTKLIAPFVTLFGTAIVAVVTYMRHFETARWFVAVCATLILFLILGTVFQRMVEKFEVDAVKREIDNRLEAEREAEEEAAKAAEEAAAAKNNLDESQI